MISINRDMVAMKNAINQDTSWEELAQVINFATELQSVALEVAINKGLHEGLKQSQIIGTLRNAGCTLSDNMMNKLIDFHSFKIELSNCTGTEVELELKEAQFRKLGKGVESTSALEKYEEYEELSTEKGSTPTRDEIERNAKLKREASKKLGRDNRRGSLPQYLTPEEIIEFREWCEENEVELSENKPKVSMMLLVGARDEVIDTLYQHLGEWGSARKLMFDVLHPDKGGNTLAFQFAKMFDDLMKSLKSLLAWAEYEDAVIAYKKEWWGKRKE